MRVYHATSSEAAAAIMRDGFRDTPPHWGFEHEFGMSGGVWVSSVPVNENEGARCADVQLVVEVDEATIADYEVIEEGAPHRTWIVPAAIVNRCPITIEDTYG
jgi:hypothetical protein